MPKPNHYQVTELIDQLGRDMPRGEWKDFLEEIASDVEARLDCVKEEMEADAESDEE